MGSVNVCSKCGNKIITGVRKYQGKLYCEHCYEIVMEEAQRFEEEKQKLISFIKELFSIQQCPELVLYALDRAIKEGKKISGIKGTLIYYYNIRGNAPDNINIIGSVIQREYTNASKYFEGIRHIRSINDQIDINVPPITVRLKKNRETFKKRNYKMEDL